MSTRTEDNQFLRTNRRRLVYESLRRNASNFPERRAVSEIGGQTHTFREFYALAAGLADALVHEFSVARGDRIGIIGYNSAEMLALFYAVPMAGGVCVALNYRASTAELASILEDCEPSLLLTDDAHRDLLMRIADGRPTAVFKEHDGPERLAILKPSAVGDVLSWSPQDDEWAPAYLFYTGGTTGAPKGVVQASANYETLATSLVASMAPVGLSRADVYLQVTPPYHGGCWALCHSFLRYGMEVRVLAEFNAEAVAHQLRSGEVTTAWFVPTMSRRVLDALSADKASTGNLGSVRAVISAGAPLSTRLESDLRSMFPRSTVINMLGQTEMTSTIITHAEPELRCVPGAAGLPVPDCEVLIVGDDNQAVPLGEVGELCYRGDMMMLGYWNRPEMTEEALRGGLFHSGDLAKVDGNGVVYLLGRKKDIIISGGVNIAPQEIEAVLLSISGVEQAVVIGVQDDDWGERVHAVLVLERDVEADQLIERARSRCRGRLSGYKVPKSWDVVDALPLTSVGKVDRNALIQRTVGGEV